MINNRAKTFILLFFGTCFQVSLVSQNITDSVFNTNINNINAIGNKLVQIKFNDTLQDSLNTIFYSTLKTLLETTNAIEYNFDSLKHVGNITSDDKQLRFFTYNLPRSNGTYIHYGFLLVYNKDFKKNKLYELIDSRNTIDNPENITLSPENWYGALYYQIITEKYDGEKIYTLIGYQGNNLYSNKKIIDVLFFTQSDKPRFGKAIFQIGKKKQRRIIFEFSRMASMMVKYDENYKMIILDHLSPLSPLHYGSFQHYGPDFSYDALKFTNGLWQFIPEVDYKPEKKKR